MIPRLKGIHKLINRSVINKWYEWGQWRYIFVTLINRRLDNFELDWIGPKFNLLVPVTIANIKCICSNQVKSDLYNFEIINKMFYQTYLLKFRKFQQSLGFG